MGVLVGTAISNLPAMRALDLAGFGQGAICKAVTFSGIRFETECSVHGAQLRPPDAKGWYS